MKAVVAAFNQEKALVGAFSVLTNLWMELFEALKNTQSLALGGVSVVECRIHRIYSVPGNTQDVIPVASSKE